MDNSRLGTNFEEITACLQTIQTSINEFDECIPGRVQKDVIEPMSSDWADERAVRVFGIFGDTMNELLTNVHNVFNSIGQSINSAATAWASSHEASFSRVDLNVPDSKLDVSPIKTDINGDRGVIIESAQSSISKLTQISASALGDLENIARAAASSGFLGGGQGEQLKATLDNIKTKINSAINEIYTTAMDEMQKTWEEYGQVGQQVKSAFEGTE